MLNDLPELRTFQQVLRNGSLTAAARVLGVSVAVISKRLASLESRVGVKLVNRTTRSLSPTEHGERLLLEVDRALGILIQAEEVLASGLDEPAGLLRVSAPVAFGRRHVVPVLGQMSERYSRLRISLSLEDRLVDVVNERIDAAVRIGEPGAGAGVTILKISDNRRVLIAAPSYLRRRGTPASPDDLKHHEILSFGHLVGPWKLFKGGDVITTEPGVARMRADSGDVAHGWCVAGLGITIRSEMDVAVEVREGVLERVLPEWHAGDAPIYTLFPQGSFMPAKTKVFVDRLLQEMAA